MGVAVLDYNQDGWPDLFVGNDRVPAKLHRNDGRGGFVDEGLRAGVALSEAGTIRGNMGADAADYDRSGRPDLIVGNFAYEMLGLYHNEDGVVFADRAPRSEVGRSSYLSTAWAVFFWTTTSMDFQTSSPPTVRTTRHKAPATVGLRSPNRRCCSGTGRTEHLVTSPDRLASRLTGRSWAGAQRMPISMATAILTSS